MSYFFQLFRTGAIRKTPQKIITKIVNEIKVTGTKTIVELGAGKGEITIPVIKKIAGNNPINYFAFEIDEHASELLKRSTPHINILNIDALNFIDVLPVSLKVNYFISSIPLSFYTKAKVNRFVNDLLKKVTADGKIIILFTAFWLIPILKKRLPASKLHFFITFPPYFLLIYTKE